MTKKYIAEFTGTFLLVFLGMGSIIISEETTLIGAEATAPIIGAIVTLLIILLGNISGAHLNPAVTIGFSVSGSFEKKEILAYSMCQFLGATMGSLLLHQIFQENINLGNTIPTAPPLISLAFEILLTFILMLIILLLSHGYKESGYAIAFIVGIIIWLEIKYAGPVSGASMNPARSFGPALISGNLNHMWLYITGPIAGSISAALVFNFIKRKKILK